MPILLILQQRYPVNDHHMTKKLTVYCEQVHALKSAAPVFVYHFGYRGKHSQTHVKPNEFPQVLSAPDTHYGVGNGDDLM